MIASKWLYDSGEDEIVYNDEWAEFGNLDLEDLNRLERDFLGAIDWSCYVDPDSFEKQLAKFEALVALREYLKRTSKQQTYTPGPTNIGMTYTELLSLTNFLGQNSPKKDGKDLKLYWSELADLAESICICALAYCAAVVVIVSSVSIVYFFSLQLALHNHHRSLEFNASDNFTLQNMPLFEYATTSFSQMDTRPQHIQMTSYFPSAKRQNLTPTDQVNYHLLLNQKANKILKCS